MISLLELQPSGEGDTAGAERISVAERVARALIALIRSGSLLPGQQLSTERELAAMLAVSRPSVRETLRGLQILGVVRVRQGGGIFVSSLKVAELLQPLQLLIALTEENFEALHETGLIIEGAVGRLIAGAIKLETIRRVHEMVAIQEALTGDPGAFRLSDTEFHRTPRATVGNPFLERISDALYLFGMEYRSLVSETPAVLARSVADHRAAVTSLEAGDPRRVAAAMARPMHSVHETTRAAFHVAWER